MSTSWDQREMLRSFGWVRETEPQNPTPATDYRKGVSIMTNIKKVAAGIILGAAFTSAPLVAFAVPASADTGAATAVSDAPSHMNIPPWGYKASAKAQHVLV